MVRRPAHLPPGDPAAAALLQRVVRTLEPGVVAAGPATAAEVAAFHEQLPRELAATPATFLPPTLAGARGRRPAAIS